MRLIGLAVVLAVSLFSALRRSPARRRQPGPRGSAISAPGTRHRCPRNWGNAPVAGPFPDQDQGVLDRGAQVEVRQLEPENFSTMRTLLHR
jgi:hypothetical protein